MIINPERLNITKEEWQALSEIFKQYMLDYLQTKNFDLRSTTHDSPHRENVCS